MTTIDNLLLKIVNDTATTIESIVSSRDARVLRSMATAVTSPTFITENQSRLLSKILKDNTSKISNFEKELVEALDVALWSKPFRKIEQVRKAYIGNNPGGELAIIIEFTFSSAIRKLLTASTKKIENLVQTNSGKIYFAELTEKNIVEIVDLLTPHSFVFDDVIKNHYDTIKSWSEEVVKSQFLLTNITHTNFQKQITADLGVDTPIDNNIILDRQMRYQYFTKISEKNGENLTSMIASRQKSKIWIDKKLFSLSDIIKSLIELKRLPALVVFDNYNNENSLKNLKILVNSLEENNIHSNVGIYFRLPNEAYGKEFNQIIATNQYNQYLDNSLQIAGVQSGKIPKFFLTNNWKPMSVVVLDTTLRHSKTAVYANCSDLIISYSDSEPIVETRVQWE